MDEKHNEDVQYERQAWGNYQYNVIDYEYDYTTYYFNDHDCYSNSFFP